MANENLMNYEERILYIVRNLIENKHYNNDVTKAAKILKKYFTDRSLATCKADLELFIATYQDAITFVESNKADYWKSKEGELDSLKEKEKLFYQSREKISETALQSLLLWIFNWYHER